MATVKGCHLVGSVPLADTETVFRTLTQAMPGRLKRIPDGETGVRRYFIAFQAPLFPELVQIVYKPNFGPESRDFSDDEVAEGLRLLDESDMKTGYDDAALASFAVFRQLKKDGVIPQHVRFQVCIPTLGNVVGFSVQKPFQPRAAELYEAALFAALRNIQEGIPHEELSIQIDMAVDMMFWEGEVVEPWWSEKDYQLNYITRMINRVDKDVDMGFHFCYGETLLLATVVRI